MADPLEYLIEFVREYVITPAPADTSVIDNDKFPKTKTKAIAAAISIAQTEGVFIYLNLAKEVLFDLHPKT
jgi:hypothetical protein